MKTKKTKKPAKKPAEYLFALYDRDGELFSSWDTWEDADSDATGPRFRDKKVKGKKVRGYTVRTYKLVPRSQEPKGVPVKVQYVDDD